MIYLDNAATSFPKAPGVAAAMTRFLAESAANPGRAGHRLAVAAEQMIDNARLRLVRMFDANDPHRLIFTHNTTDAINMAIKGVLAHMPTGTHVIATVLEHNSVSRPLVALRNAGRIELTQVDCSVDGFIDPDDIHREIRPATRLLVMTHASNVLGTIQDAVAVGRLAREHDLLFLLDAAQTAGVAPISINKMGVDLLAFPGHKSLLGPTGVGGLYVGERCPVPQPGSDATGSRGFGPWREGGTGGDSASATQPTELPYFLEGGTPNTVGIAGLDAAVDFLASRPAGSILQHEQTLVQAVMDRLANDSRVEIYGTRDAKRRVGTVSINIKGCDAADVGSILDHSFDIAVRPGLHCAPYAHRRIGTFPGGAVRISPGAFNTGEQVASLVDALVEISESR